MLDEVGALASGRDHWGALEGCQCAVGLVDGEPREHFGATP